MKCYGLEAKASTSFAVGKCIIIVVCKLILGFKNDNPIVMSGYVCLTENYLWRANR